MRCSDMEQQPNPEQGQLQDFFQSELLAIEQDEQLAVPEGVITEEMRQVGAEMLVAIYNKYGDPNSETFKQYHNHQHALDVLKRAWEQLLLHRSEFSERFTDHDYRLLFFAALGHDGVHGNGGGLGTDEELSAEWTIPYMRRLGFSDEDCMRVSEVICVTTVYKRESDGAIIQTYIREGSEDPLKLIMANADINGILMGGIPAFANDVLNLWLENNKKAAGDIAEHKEELATFFGTQLEFVETRVKELWGDFQYYYKEDAQKISQLYEETFTRATRDALGAIRTIDRMSNLVELLIDEMVSVIEATSGDDQTKLAAAKARLIYRLERKPKQK